MPLSIAIVLYFTQPISAAVVNFLLAKESLSKIEIMSIISAMIGVIILTSPSTLIPNLNHEEQSSVKDKKEYPYYYAGVFFTLMGSLFSGFAYFTMRKIGTRLRSTTTTFYFGIFSSIFSFIVFAIAPG
jgi:drug/metabolite transporter (DMT)-like permease